MNVELLASVIWLLLVGGFLVATLRTETGLEWPQSTRSGDTSLSRDSINWLAALAVGAALGICLMLN